PSPHVPRRFHPICGGLAGRAAHRASAADRTVRRGQRSHRLVPAGALRAAIAWSGDAEMQHSRRRLFAAAAGAVAAASLGASKQANAQPGTHISFGPLKQVKAGVLDVGYAEAGPSNGPVAILMHGWPYDIYSYVDVAPRLAEAGYRVVVPYIRGYGTTQFLS